jgi:phosphatidylglycerophosphate synthase
MEAACSLILPPSVVLDAGALREWIGRTGDGDRVTATTADAAAGPLVVPGVFLRSCIQAAHRGQSALEKFLERLDEERRLIRLPWEAGPYHPVRSAGEIPEIERVMLATLRSPDDGPLVDRYVNRRLSAILTRGLLNSRVTPNQVTGASLVTGLLGAWLLGGEDGARSLLGLILFQLSVILDHVDGEIARLKFLFSRLGKWLDNFSDHAVDLAVIAFLTWRVAEGHPAGYFITLSLAAALGVTGAFLVVFGWSLSGGRREVRTTATARLVARVLATLANRDGFCLPLWLAVLLGRPEWFLWALAIGANAYWIAWLFVYGIPARPRATEVGSAV